MAFDKGISLHGIFVNSVTELCEHAVHWLTLSIDDVIIMIQDLYVVISDKARCG